ncbi:MaoC/PaaZ C-terminal domain-containing protein [Streptomyces durocortorensis]|uniref:MaoC family dehydratase N-terminal domain-containing protein n=1 Tax=Streptomyces durocortorensis TaxID=2811104 RepID=A0ABS2HTX1_9ACTN|nr:MaoC/PaaZ C-terminal domain-containing protein [Streptomyces durocortorensis]MBM7053818.1 MaoC family dehydratase N-terminal domain-containing protein [Streptomyces durocortorensis]
MTTLPDSALDPSAPMLDAAAALRYRTVTRRALGRPEPGRAVAGPLAAFVLTHPLAERTVADLAAGHGPFSLVHLAQEIELHRPPRPGAPLDAAAELEAVRVEPKGTRLVLTTTLADRATGAEQARLTAHILLVGIRAAEPRGTLVPTAAVRQETPGATLSSDLAIDRAWIAEYGHAAGDLNPVHLDTEAARSAGFADVIAHGMSLVALAVEEAAERYADGDVDRVRAIGARFARPVLPGEATSLDLTPLADGDTVAFTVRSQGAVAVKGGWLRLAPATGAGR